jgi:hypothetical protein
MKSGQIWQTESGQGIGDVKHQLTDDELVHLRIIRTVARAQVHYRFKRFQKSLCKAENDDPNVRVSTDPDAVTCKNCYARAASLLQSKEFNE